MKTKEYVRGYGPELDPDRALEFERDLFDDFSATVRTRAQQGGLNPTKFQACQKEIEAKFRAIQVGMKVPDSVLDSLKVKLQEVYHEMFGSTMPQEYLLAASLARQIRKST